MPPRTTRKSYRPRASDRTMVGTFCNRTACRIRNRRRRHDSNMTLRKKKTPRASQHYMGWRAGQKSLLLPVAGEFFLLTLPFIERAYRRKKRCTGSTRRLFVHWHEPARQTARELAQTSAYACSKRERNKIEALFSELQLRVGLRRVRLRRLWNVSEQFYLAATAQNLKRLVRFLAQRASVPIPCST